jgi:hypothetical protein
MHLDKRSEPDYLSFFLLLGRPPVRDGLQEDAATATLPVQATLESKRVPRVGVVYYSLYLCVP